MRLDKEELLKSGLLEQYVLGILDEDERVEIEALINDSDELGEYVHNLRVTLTAVAHQNGVRAGHFSRKPKSAVGSYGNGPKKLFLAVLIPLLLGFNLYLGYAIHEYKQRAINAERLYASHLLEDHEPVHKEHLTAFLSDKQTRVVEIKGSVEGCVYSAYVYSNEMKQKAYFMGEQLPGDISGVFQLWAYNGEQMISTAAVSNNYATNAIIPIRYFPNVKSYHLTVEEGGESAFPCHEQLIAKGSL
jgi:hypothetical protein